MPVTLTDEQMAQLKAQFERLNSIADGATQIWNDPKLSDRAKALWKEKFPDGQIPDYDAEQRINARLDRERREREEAEKARADKELDERIKRQRSDVQKRFGFTDDAMGRLEQMMQERHVGDYEVAASYLASQEPKPSEGGEDYDQHFWNHQNRPEYKEVAEDPEGYARREIMRAIRRDDLQRQTR